MRKFKFIGDSSRFKWLRNPVNGIDYSIDEINRMRANKGRDLDFLDLSIRKEDWQEVTEHEPKPLHKDTDLGYFAGLAMRSLLSNQVMMDNVERPSIDWLKETSVIIAKELIKQLDNEK